MTDMAMDSAAVPNWPTGCAKDKASRQETVELLLVDDDHEFRAAACMELEDLGFGVTGIPDGEAMFNHLDSGNRVDVIVLDWKMPGRRGVDFLTPLRERRISVPVIFFTGVPATAHESAALDGGAIDFVDKARGLPILAKRIRRIIEAGIPRKEAADELRYGALSLRPSIRRATWRGADVNLTVTEYNIVEFMVSHAGDHVTYRAIYDCVHCAGFVAGSGDEGYRTNVRSTVKRIRNKFRALDADFSEIQNFAAFGYRWRPAGA
jgi:two-component system response regulator ChvI